MARTTWRTRTVPVPLLVPVVSSTPSPDDRSFSTLVLSWIWPPAASMASASPQASLAGLTIATPLRSSSPPR